VFLLGFAAVFVIFSVFRHLRSRAKVQGAAPAPSA
jgi:hypothetical protein